MKDVFFSAIDSEIKELDKNARKEYLEDRIEHYSSFRQSLAFIDPYEVITKIDPIRFFVISMELYDKNFEAAQCLIDLNSMASTVGKVIAEQDIKQSGDFSALFRNVTILNIKGFSDALELFDETSEYYNSPAKYALDAGKRCRHKHINSDEIVDAIVTVFDTGKKFFGNDFTGIESVFSLMKDNEYLDKFSLFLQILNDQLLLKQSYSPEGMTITDYEYDVLKPLGQKVDKDIRKKEKELRNIKKYNESIKSRYTSLKEKIDSANKNTLLTVDFIEPLALNNEVIETAFYMYSIVHNHRIYLDILNSKHHNLGYLCAMYEIDPSKFTDEDLERFRSIGYERVESFFGFISNTNIFKLIKDNPKLVDIIEHSTEESINNICDGIREDFLDINVVSNMIEVLFDENKDKVDENISILRDSKIDVKTLSSSSSTILLQNTTDTLDNTILLKRYLSTDNIRSLDNFVMLEYSRYFDMMDYLIENDLYSNMCIDYSLINDESRNIALKVIISRMIGYEYMNTKGKIKTNVTTPNKFMVPDSQLDEYIMTYNPGNINPNYLDIIRNSKNNKISEDVCKLPIVKALDEKYGQDDLIYDINGEKISKPKVLRYLTTLDAANTKGDELSDMVFNAIIINKITDDFGVLKIQKAIDSFNDNFGNKVMNKNTGN